MVSVPLTAEERHRQVREARRGLEQMNAVREMAENKAERRRDAEWAKEQEDRRTPEERERDEEETDALLLFVSNTTGAIESYYSSEGKL